MAVSDAVHSSAALENAALANQTKVQSRRGFIILFPPVALLRAASNRKQSFSLLRIAPVNRCLSSFVVMRMDHDFHIAVAIQIQHRDYFVSVRRVEAPLFLFGLRISLGIKFP